VADGGKRRGANYQSKDQIDILLGVTFFTTMLLLWSWMIQVARAACWSASGTVDVVVNEQKTMAVPVGVSCGTLADAGILAGLGLWGWPARVPSVE